jgi:exonuclease VII small subunit
VEPRIDDGAELLQAALHQAQKVAQTLENQRQDLSRAAPRFDQGTELLGRASRAAEGVAAALEHAISRDLKPETRS